MYRLAQPAPPLARYVDNYWAVYVPQGASIDLRVEVFVDLRADLVFTFGAPYGRTRIGHEPEVLSRSNLDAQRSYPIQIAQRGEVVVTGVRFHVGGLAPFVRASVHTWSDRVVDPQEVFGDDASALEDSLRAHGPDLQAQTATLDAFFLARLRVDDGQRAIEALRAEIEADRALTRIDALCARRGISQRSADRLFRERLGFGPKTYSRVVRFQRALTRLKTDPGCTLAEVAASCGFYDQPHFVREFRAFAGSAPRTRVGYFPEGAPADFSPNLVQFGASGGQSVQDVAGPEGHPAATPKGGAS